MKSLIEERSSRVDTDEKRTGKMDSRIEKKKKLPRTQNNNKMLKLWRVD